MTSNKQKLRQLMIMTSIKIINSIIYDEEKLIERVLYQAIVLLLDGVEGSYCPFGINSISKDLLLVG